MTESEQEDESVNRASTLLLTVFEADSFSFLDILYEATTEHPAQVEMYTEDVKVGEWRTIKFSGALPAQEKNQLIARIRRLQEAAKFARESANGIDVEQQKTADKIFGYLFGAQS